MTRCSVILIKLLRHPFVARILHQQRRNDQRMTKASMFIIRQFEVRTQFRARLQRKRKEKRKALKSQPTWIQSAVDQRLWFVSTILALYKFVCMYVSQENIVDRQRDCGCTDCSGHLSCHRCSQSNNEWCLQDTGYAPWRLISYVQSSQDDVLYRTTSSNTDQWITSAPLWYYDG